MEKLFILPGFSFSFWELGFEIWTVLLWRSKSNLKLPLETFEPCFSIKNIYL